MTVVGLLSAIPAGSRAHDIEASRARVRKDARRLAQTLDMYRRRPVVSDGIRSADDQLRLLGTAEIELALGDSTRALEILMARLADPRFRRMPAYVNTLLLTSEILESRGEDEGALIYAEIALTKGGSAEQMAEAGARWFRVARRTQRLERRSEMYSLWRKQGGEGAAGTEQAAQARYEVAFGLRADDAFEDALALLAEVPSETAFGSRAAFLAGVVWTELGNLANAERWFAAIMEWPLPALDDDHPQMGIERQVRTLAALSAGRLRFERGDLLGAARAYRKVRPESPYGAEACWERAFLALEQNRRRGALKAFQCVVDLGARGQRGLDARLFKASLLAHVRRYSDSIASYQLLRDSLVGQYTLFRQGAAEQTRPATFLFQAMERSASRTPDPVPPSPGAPTLFADAWTPEVDQAYRVDRGAKASTVALATVLEDLEEVEQAVGQGTAFVAFRMRRAYLELLLRQVRHLEGHAGQAATRAQASPAGGAHDHSDDAVRLQDTIDELRELGRAVEKDLAALDAEQEDRRRYAQTALTELRADISAIRADLARVEQDASTPSDRVARQAILRIQVALREAAMKAEVGVLDTYWLRKQHRTRAVEALLREQAESEQQLEQALDNPE